VQLHADEYEVVAWISSQEQALADLARLAAHLGVLDDAQLPPADRAQRALDWLGECEGSWLLVLDNIESAEQLLSLLPHGAAGHVLITSRDRSLRQFGPMLTLDVFDQDVAARYLIERSGRTHDEPAARALANALGYLPLALAHAAAYCQDGTDNLAGAYPSSRSRSASRLGAELVGEGAQVLDVLSVEGGRAGGRHDRCLRCTGGDVGAAGAVRAAVGEPRLVRGDEPALGCRAAEVAEDRAVQRLDPLVSRICSRKALPECRAHRQRRATCNDDAYGLSARTYDT
jgi:hypothetical protein